MIKNYTSARDAHIASILASADKNANKSGDKTTRKKISTLSAAETAFFHAFFGQAPLEDLQWLDATSALAIARDAHRFAQSRKGVDATITVAASPLKEAEHANSTIIRVLGDDMPFLVDSLANLMHKLGVRVELTLHPILAVKRDAKGTLTTVTSAEESPDLSHESLIIMLARALPVGLTPAALEQHIQRVLRKVRASVSDWKRMSARVLELAEPFDTALPGIPRGEASESADFIRWLANKNFVFLGVADFTSAAKGTLSIQSKTALGLYRLPELDTTPDGASPIEYSSAALSTRFIAITKSSEPCEVHRAVPMDMIVIKRFDDTGAIVGETRILGLFTSNVYYQTSDAIPLLRRKVSRVLDRSGFDPVSHNGKSLKAILEFLPRDEIFQLSEEELFPLIMGVLTLESRPKVRVFTRLDAFERYASCLVYVPRERFTTSVREHIAKLLARAYAGEVITFYTQVSDSPLARINILISTTPGHVPSPALEAIEAEITALTNQFSDALQLACLSQFGKKEGDAIAAAYANAFDNAYITTHSAVSAASDIVRIREAISGDGLALELFNRAGLHKTGESDIHLKCYTTDTSSTLSDVVPMLENMGTTLVEVHPHTVRPAGAPAVLVRDFVLRLPAGTALNLNTEKARLEVALRAIWRKQFADDGLNGLLFKTTLNAREVDVLRAYTRYMRQINFPFGQMVIWRTLNTHAGVAEQLIAYFHARFAPNIKSRESAMEKAKSHIFTALESISNLNEDRILRRLLELMEATVRTNAYQPQVGGSQKHYISFKFLSRAIPELPLPKPYAEIFVYAIDMEGIHLRGDTVARGGLRWSDRPEDFRTEVLGLVKAQMVKNAVIVPSGSKGGFIVKHPPADKSKQQEEAIRCYKIFLSGLLDITDNIVSGKVVPPAHVTRHDGDDPYLVVAADKGTASFSDIANSVSADYGFWLGDAFASGGSAGYDHKEMAITARGGWISVERHFREMGRDIGNYENKTKGTHSFTAVGIGDMSGDVFGNGMLLSNAMQLVAAFNHRHIFLDPTPDAKASFAERERLFKLPRSGWSDYNPKLISRGGGVYERSVKSISLSKEAQTALGTDVKTASPDELIQIILKAPVDLLWNGGIGTYVKASDESHEEVGDRTNNAVRVNGSDLRCHIVGEGGNLGFTQLGRIEYARSGGQSSGDKMGGRLNTDAIDNSAGVDCSDHEVNIKIALGRALESKSLTLSKRNALLKAMEDEVAHLVLEDNRLQTQALTLAEAHSPALLEPLAQLMHDLEKQGFLNREVEFLPSDKEISELKAQGLGLTRPELSVLLAYSKLALTRDLKGSTRLLDAHYTADLVRYFPTAMHKPYAKEIAAHPLKAEIIATVLINEIINRLGIVSVHQAMVDTGEQAQTIVDAYVFVRDVFGISKLWSGIEALDGDVTPALQLELFSAIRQFVAQQLRFVARHVPKPLPFGQLIPTYQATCSAIANSWQRVLSPSESQRIKAEVARLTAAGAPEPLALTLTLLPSLAAAGIILQATQGKAAASSSKKAGGAPSHIPQAASIHFALEHALSLPQLARSIAALPQSTAWQRQASATASAQVAELQSRLLSHIIKQHGSGEKAISSWMHSRDAAFKRYQRFLASLGAIDILDAAMIFVALHELEVLISGE